MFQIDVYLPSRLGHGTDLWDSYVVYADSQLRALQQAQRDNMNAPAAPYFVVRFLEN